MTRAPSIGLLGGTFNPVHDGHLAIARDAIRLFSLDELWLVPSAVPPHKPPPPGATSADRLAMLRLAVDALPGVPLRVCDIEFSLPPPSYTLHTVRALQKLNPGARFSFVIGGDTLPQLHTWYHPLELLETLPILSLARPGAPTPSPADLHLPPPWPDRLLANLRTASLVPAASSEIRRELALARTSSLVPAPVLSYILENNLYLEPTP